MCAVATRIGKILKCEGAGTVEFILDLATGTFYFLEVNARLQMEHPITEECTGLDLVSLQFFVASGGRLEGLSNLQEVPQEGHAIECRLCAEDPSCDYAPQTGLIRLWEPPADLKHVRVETAVSTGAIVSMYFDSMIAKVLVWAPTRVLPVERMADVLSRTACLGVITNQLFLQACLLHEGFRRVDYTTSFIPSNIQDLLKSPYSRALKVPYKYLAAIPRMFLQNSWNQENARLVSPSPFSSIPLGFRAQRFDKTNKPCDIVAMFEALQLKETSPYVCVWKSDQTDPNKILTVRIATITAIKVIPTLRQRSRPLL